MVNHEVEKVVKREVRWPAEPGLPSSEASHHVPTDSPLLTQGKGHTGWVAF